MGLRSNAPITVGIVVFTLVVLAITLVVIASLIFILIFASQFLPRYLNEGKQWQAMRVPTVQCTTGRVQSPRDRQLPSVASSYVVRNCRSMEGNGKQGSPIGYSELSSLQRTQSWLIPKPFDHWFYFA